MNRQSGVGFFLYLGLWCRASAGPGPRRLLAFLKQELSVLANLLPILVKLRHPGMRSRHWIEFYSIFDKSILQRIECADGVDVGANARDRPTHRNYTLPMLLKLPLKVGSANRMYPSFCPVA